MSVVSCRATVKGIAMLTEEKMAALLCVFVPAGSHTHITSVSLLAGMEVRLLND